MLPNRKKPCKNCPFRKDCHQGWLGEERMTEILNAESFTCHKTEEPNRLQCAGFMIIKGEESEFVFMANRLGLDTGVTGQELIFETKQECIEHHKN